MSAIRRTVTVSLTPAEGAALYEASRGLQMKVAEDTFWRTDDWLSARMQLECALRGEGVVSPLSQQLRQQGR